MACGLFRSGLKTRLDFSESEHWGEHWSELSAVTVVFCRQYHKSENRVFGFVIRRFERTRFGVLK